MARPPVLRRNGIVLRVLTRHDADAWLAGEDDAQRRAFNAPRSSTRPDVEAAIERWTASWDDDGPVRQWGIFAMPALTLVGGVELRDRGDRRANLSYAVFPDARRRHIATDAVLAACEWGSSNLPVDAIVAIIDPENPASIGVARAAGFVDDGPADPWEHNLDRPMLRLVLPTRST
jgi:ribosomal-protein-alanine N-acetyltransferase